MRGVFSRTVAACLLVVVLLAPSAFASDSTTDASLWAEFVAWFESKLGVPGGFTGTDEDLFTVWLMSRLVIPGG
jgi:hypothetical protein